MRSFRLNRPRRKKKEKTPGKRPAGIVLPFRPNMPNIRERVDARFIIYKEKLRFLVPWRRLAVTFILIFLGGLGSAMTHARNTVLENEITRAERDLRAYQETNFALNSQRDEMHTWYEIERIATERLGMAHPDPAQIISINVPRQGTVVLNTDADVLPRQNYFWQEIVAFISGLLNQIFGGGE